MPKKHDIAIGDIIKAYTKGFHVVTAIEPRTNNTDLIYYKCVLDSNGKKIKSKKVFVCDAAWCTKITLEKANELITYDLEYFETKKKNLLELINASRHEQTVV